MSQFSNWIAFAALVVSIVSALMSVLSHIEAIRTRKENTDLQKQNIKLQKRLVELEEGRENDRISQSQKASLVARLEKRNEGTILYLVIENKGESVARNIEVSFDNGRPLLELLKDEEAARYREFSVKPKTSIECRLWPLNRRSYRPQKVFISWSDSSGELGQYEEYL